MRLIKNLLKKIKKNKKKITVGTINEDPRDQWICNKLKTIPKGYRILDAGAGELKYKPYCSHLEYVSQDFAQYDGTGNSIGLQTGDWDQSKLDIICDIIDIPRPNESFDAVICTEVFEHLSEPILAIKEFSRLLKSGSKLMITAPFCSLTHFAPYHFSSGFNKYFYEKHLIDNNFKILEIDYNGNFFEFIAQELRRVDSIAQKYSNDNLTPKEKLCLNQFLETLQRLSDKDAGSNELLSFGLHVLAEKL